MSIQFDIAKQIIAETCPNRKLKLENIRLFADIIQPKKYQKGDIILNEGDICNCLFYIDDFCTQDVGDGTADCNFYAFDLIKNE